MGNSVSKRATLLLIAVLVVSSVVLVKFAPASAVATPSVPEFTLRYEESSHYVPPVYSVDKYTGEQVLTTPGYTVEEKSIIFTIKNQAFTPTTEPDGNVTSLYYNVRAKGHFEEGWTYLPGHIVAESSGYTVASYAVGGDADNELLRYVPDEGQLDFQVEALIGYYTRTMPSCYQYNDVFTGETSGWSGTQTIKIGDGQTSTPSPSFPPTQQAQLTLNCSSSASSSNFRVDISGSLTYDSVGVSNAQVLLSYSLDGGYNWISLTTVYTDDNGDFNAVWMPDVSGNNRLRAEWGGDVYRSAVSTTITFAVTAFDEEKPFDEQDVFSVTTNSILTGLVFDVETNELNFGVEGADGTAGYVNVYISKNFLSDVSGLKVYLDGEELEFTTETQDDAWVISFEYTHSAHQVTLDLSSVAVLEENQILQVLVVALPIAVVILFLGIMKLKGRKTKTDAK